MILEFYSRRTQVKIIAITPKVDSLITNQLKLQIDDKTLFSKNSYSFKPDPTIINVEHSTNTIKRYENFCF